MVDPIEVIDLPIFAEAEHAWRQLPSHLRNKQLCVTTITGKTNDPTFGTGSLVYDWDNMTVDVDGNQVVNQFEAPLDESDFTEIVDIFKHTVFGQMVVAIKSKFKVGRVRIMPLQPKTCLTWHQDYDMRLHYPIVTNEKAKLVIEDSAHYIKPRQWSLVDTRKYHTVFNGGNETRVHLVANMID